jgi:predicted alpha-1,6-mannanase (GH76 family)
MRRIAFFSLAFPLFLRAAEFLEREALTRRIADGVGVLDRLYWSPTLNIWLDRAGDDLRAHYEGRLNPPWWSSANAVEVLIDFMNASGLKDHEAAVEALYELHKTRGGTSARLIAELKRRGQWSAADDEKAKRHTDKADGPGEAKTDYYTEFRNEYLDDSGWWGIAWLKMYDRTRAEKYLTTAKAIHAHMAKNWRPDKDGGVMWGEAADKLTPNAITNSLFLILSARLYERTHEPAYLRWAEQSHEWFHARALFDGTGVVDAPGHQADYWTYNQGAFIGGLVALYQATGRAAYLEEAVQVADNILQGSGLVLPGGVLVEKLGTSGWDPGLFKGIFARYLGQLRDVLKAGKLHPELALEIDRVLRASAASMLENSLAADGQYTIEWHKDAKDQTRNFNTQTSALALLVAVLAGADPK